MVVAVGNVIVGRCGVVCMVGLGEADGVGAWLFEGEGVSWGWLSFGVSINRGAIAKICTSAQPQ